MAFTNRIVLYSLYSLVLTFLLTTVAPQFSQAQLACPERTIQQITDEPSGNSEDASISGDGEWVSFASRADINGGNPDDDSQVYLTKIGSGQIIQITSSTTGQSDEPSTNADGTVVAFESGANIFGNNPTGFNQIYYYHRPTDTLTQVTFDINFASNVPSISADGNIIAFQSTSDHTGGNPDNNSEIFTYNVGADAFSQITDSTGGNSAGSSISGDGTIIAFRSSADITGQNPLLVSQLFVADTVANTVTQITNVPNGGIFSISTSANGKWVSFYTDEDVIGQNPENQFEVFLLELDTGVITQITDVSTGGVGDLSLNANGERIAFESRGDHGTVPPDGNREIYVFNSPTDSFTQITNVPLGSNDDSEDPSIDYVGTNIAFRSETNINGGNPEGNREIYVANCIDRDDIAVPTLSEWGLIAMAGVLGIVGFMVARRRKVTA